MIDQQSNTSELNLSQSYTIEEEQDEFYNSNEEYFLDCCRFGQIDELKILIKEKEQFDYFSLDNNLNNPFHMACANGHVEIIMFLLDLMKNTQDKIIWNKLINQQNSDGNTPLHWAVINKQIESVKVMLQEGADVNLKNEFGKNVFEEAQMNDSDEVTNQILETIVPYLNFNLENNNENNKNNEEQIIPIQENSQEDDEEEEQDLKQININANSISQNNQKIIISQEGKQLNEQ